MRHAASSFPAGGPVTQTPSADPSAEQPDAWTQDDIVVSAAETFALLPRPSGAAMEAFTALLTEYWPTTGAKARADVSATLRRSRRVSARVIAVLDAIASDATAPDMTAAAAGSASEPVFASRSRASAARDITVRVSTSRRPLAPPPLVADEDNLATTMWAEMNDQDRMTEDLMPALDEIWGEDAAAEDEDGAAHARALLRHAALTGERGPVVQPRSIAERLDTADHYADALSDLLHLPRAEGRAVLSNVPGTLIALRTLGLAARRAVGLVARWHGVDAAPLLPAYRGLRLTQCLDAVSDWRTIAAREDRIANDRENGERVSLTG